MNLSELKAAILKDGVIDADEAKQVREAIFADGTIDRAEADFLFEVNDAVSGKANHESWRALFVEALTKHLLADEKTPGVLDADELTWLVSKIQGDGAIDGSELALVVEISRVAKSTPPAFQDFTLRTLKQSVLADGVLDADEVEMIRTVIYGEGGGEGAGVSRAEADFLFDINDGVSGKQNHASWQALFVNAITNHLLEDEGSPGIVDEAEGDWLMKRIEGDGNFDDIEKAILSNIKAKSKSVTGKLKFTIEMHKI
ncbi:MAG: hypothetical protein Q8O67_13475 [Deltaproteobacteria bacterium]|nr:hypothetical protein [Deltaproteobacteria bacterium]